MCVCRSVAGPGGRNRIGRLVLLSLLGALASGCASLDRESYSLVIRKKAHRYTPLSPLEKARVDKLKESADRGKASPPEPPGLDPGLVDLSHDLEPFRPFAYCIEHESAHVPESIIAVAAAPVEYPVGLSVHLGATAVRGTIDKIVGLWNFLFPGESGEGDDRPEEKERPPK